MGKLAKVNVIGQVSTLRAIADYTCALTDVMCKLWPPRLQLQQFDRTLQQLQAMIDACSKDQDHWVEMMKQGNLQAAAGTGQPQLMQTFGQQFDLARGQREQLEARKVVVGNLRRDLAQRYFEVSVGEMRELQKLLPPALAAARAEMELLVDLVEIREIFERVARRGEEDARGVLVEAARLSTEAAAGMQPANPPET